MINTEYLYNDVEKQLAVIKTYSFTQKHRKTLFQIFANDGCAEFENRDPNIYEDVDGNEISWQICDELVEMGLLWEDEESYDVYFELTDHGKNLLNELV